ncbi:MAG: NAD(P)-dependent oxidoreductase [Janthinobacterium lividum]
MATRKPRAVDGHPETPPQGASQPAVGMIGLGIMGSAMAANLVQSGFPVHGYDLAPEALKRLKNDGGTPHASIAGVAEACDCFLLSLPSVGALAAVAAELAASARRGSVVAELSTLPIEAKEQARAMLAAAGIELLDCPLSGTGAQAKNRDIAIYASGDAAAISRMAPVFEGFGRARYDVGSFGKGMQMKLVANLLVAIHNVSTAEAMLMGTRMGLDAADIVRVVADGAGGSRMFQVRGPTMADRSWDAATMKVSVWQKDMKLIGDMLRDLTIPAPLFSASVPVYQAAMALGHAEHDTAAVYDVLERWALPIPVPVPVPVTVQKPARRGKAKAS